MPGCTVMMQICGRLHARGAAEEHAGAICPRMLRAYAVGRE